MENDYIHIAQEIAVQSTVTHYKIERPSLFAASQYKVYNDKVTLEHKKKLGQFFSPLELSQFMSSFCSIDKQFLKVLDPGCGTGVLCCTLLEYLAESTLLESVQLVCYEMDVDIIPYLKKSLVNLHRWLNNRQISFVFQIVSKDFVLDSIALFTEYDEHNGFDIIISNPPYFKLPADDVRVKDSESFIGRQFNIYSMFMAYSARLLKPAGEMIFVTPRSFASGTYFRRFRNYFFNTVTIEKIHVFHSRREIFNKDDVSQDNIILKASKGVEKYRSITISSSHGLQDIDSAESINLPLENIIDYSSSEQILHIPTNNEDEKILQLFSGWKHKLSDFNIKVSTGRVVYFRAKKFLMSESSDEFLTIPLIWLHNVNNMSLDWPVKYRYYDQYFKYDKESQKLTIPNKNYIFVRRFSGKEDKQRVIAAPYINETPEIPALAIENRVNYLYKAKGEFTPNEVFSLCRFLNSIEFNQYFHTFSGSLNISATELRDICFPIDWQTN